MIIQSIFNPKDSEYEFGYNAKQDCVKCYKATIEIEEWRTNDVDRHTSFNEYPLDPWLIPIERECPPAWETKKQRGEIIFYRNCELAHY